MNGVNPRHLEWHFLWVSIDIEAISVDERKRADIPVSHEW